MLKDSILFVVLKANIWVFKQKVKLATEIRLQQSLVSCLISHLFTFTTATPTDFFSTNFNYPKIKSELFLCLSCATQMCFSKMIGWMDGWMDGWMELWCCCQFLPFQLWFWIIQTATFIICLSNNPKHCDAENTQLCPHRSRQLLQSFGPHFILAQCSSLINELVYKNITLCSTWPHQFEMICPRTPTRIKIFISTE